MECFSRALEVIGELHVQDPKQHGKSVQDGDNLLIKHWRNFDYNKENVTQLPQISHCPSPNPSPAPNSQLTCT